MSENTSRPPAAVKKIHYKNEFELCYLRHKYIRKTTENPVQEELVPFLPIAAKMAKRTYYTYNGLFNIVGFDVEDLVAISNIHLISFLGLFSLDKLPEKYSDFVSYHINKNKSRPTKEQLLDKNKANCTLFLKQRMEDVVRICHQKAKNIKGTPVQQYLFFYGHKKPPAILNNLLKNHETYGYRKLDQRIYKSIRKKIQSNLHFRLEDGPVFRFNNMYYVAVKLDQKNLSLNDFSGAGLDPYDNIHNMTPEQIMFSVESDDSFKENKKNFYFKSKTQRGKIIKEFIKENRKNINLSKEIETARKMLKSLI